MIDKVRFALHLKRALLEKSFISPVFAKLIQPGDTVIDAGAQMGQFTRRASEIGAHTHAFEPGEYQRRLLNAAIRWRRMKNVYVHPVALGDIAQTAILVTPRKKRGDRGIGLSSLVPEKERDVFSTESVTVERLDDYVFQTDPTFIKADIEGYEGRMLVGAEQLIKRSRPSLLLEMSDEHFKRAHDTFNGVKDWLINQDYKSFVMVNNKFLVEDDLNSVSSTDAFWIHQDRIGHYPQDLYAK